VVSVGVKVIVGVKEMFVAKKDEVGLTEISGVTVNAFCWEPPMADLVGVIILGATSFARIISVGEGLPTAGVPRLTVFE